MSSLSNITQTVLTRKPEKDEKEKRKGVQEVNDEDPILWSPHHILRKSPIKNSDEKDDEVYHVDVTLSEDEDVNEGERSESDARPLSSHFSASQKELHWRIEKKSLASA